MGESGNWLDEVVIRDWLDSVVNMKKLEYFVSRLNESIGMIAVSNRVHIEGIEIIAESMGFKLQEECRPCTQYPYGYSFDYKGHIFHEVKKERLPGYDV